MVNTSGSSRCRRGWHLLKRLILLKLLLGGICASAVEIRIASYNVEHGVGRFNTQAGTFTDVFQEAKYAAVSAVVARIDADVIGFQELYASAEHFAGWMKLAEELGYPYWSLSEQGDIPSHTMRRGVFSRYPILSEHSIKAPPGTAEMTRAPMRVVIDVPDAAAPLVLWNVHHRSGGGHFRSF